MNIDKRKDLITIEKQKITKLHSKEMSTLEISKELCWNHQMIKKAVENITKLRTWSKGIDFRNLLPQDEHKLKWFIAK